MLGLDPGSLKTGWCVVEGSGRRQQVIEAGLWRLPARQPFAARLGELNTRTLEIVERFLPHAAAVESPFHGVSSRSALQLAQARGALLAALGSRGIDVFEYAPATVKKAVTGDGRADKDQVRSMVGRLLGYDTQEVGDDLSDALAVAWCHYGHIGLSEALARSATRHGSTARRRPRAPR